MAPDKTITKYINAYTPTSLTPAQWALASGPVREVALAAEPGSEQVAGTLASALSSFLAGPYGWPQDSAPQLDVLLTEYAIGARYAEVLARSSSSATTARKSLRRLASAARKVAGQKAVNAPSPSEIRMAALVHSAPQAPILQFNTLHMADAGTPLTEDLLRYVIKSVLQSKTTASAATAGTLCAADAAQTALAAPNYALRTEAVPDTTTPTARKGRTPAKPISQRELRRRDSANRKAYKLATGGPVLAPEPDLSELPTVVQDKLASYEPQATSDRNLWTDLQTLTIRMAAGYRPRSAGGTRNVCTEVRRFLTWVWNQPLRENPEAPPSALEVLTPKLVDAYVTQLKVGGKSRASVATSRSIIRRAVASLDANHTVHAVPKTAAAPPYTPQECERFVYLAANQPTEGRTRAAAFILGLSLGAGLAAEDMRHLRCKHITEHDTRGPRPYLTVTVPNENRARSVVIRHQYSELVRSGLALLSSANDLLIGEKEDRKNLIPEPHKILTTANGTAVRVSVNRLRTTWLFALMNAPVPLADLLQMAGRRSARPLADLIPLCPVSNTEEVAAVVGPVLDAGHKQVAL